jgi:hypothetical protein
MNIVFCRLRHLRKSEQKYCEYKHCGQAKMNETNDVVDLNVG